MRDDSVMAVEEERAAAYERLVQLRRLAEERRRTMPEYPDSPEQVAEMAENMAWIWPLQLDAIARAAVNVPVPPWPRLTL